MVNYIAYNVGGHFSMAVKQTIPKGSVLGK